MTLQTQSATPAAREVEHFWYASYPPGIPKTIDPDTYSSLPAMLLDACTRHARLPAFECLGTTVTYADWERVSRAFAAFLVQEAKSHRGDRIAIMLPNLLAYPVAFLGAVRAGLTVVNVNPLYTPRELKEQLIDFRRYRDRDHGEFRPRARAGLGRHPDLFTSWSRGSATSCRRSSARYSISPTPMCARQCRLGALGFTLLHKACSRVPGAHYADAAPGPTSPALLQYTGGTTGVAKAAILTHRNLVANTLQCRAVIGPICRKSKGAC